MREYFSCPYLDSLVELTAERRFHIELKHPEILLSRVRHVARALSAPDLVIRSRTWDRARLFVRQYDRSGRGLKIVVVVIIGRERIRRPWIVTAYLSRDVPRGVIEWRRN